MEQKNWKMGYKKWKRALSCFALLVFAFSIMPMMEEARADSITSNDIDRALENFNCQPGKYWTYNTRNGWSWDWVGSDHAKQVTETKTEDVIGQDKWTGYFWPNKAKSYSSGWAQCAGFTQFLGWAVTGKKLSNWKTYKTFDGITSLQVGDVVAIGYKKSDGSKSTHMAMVYSISGGKVKFIQCHGSSSNKIDIGYFSINSAPTTFEEIKKRQTHTYKNGIVLYRYTGSVNIQKPANSPIKEEYPIYDRTSLNAYYRFTHDDESRSLPYESSTVTTSYSKDSWVKALASVRNKYDNIWYELKDGSYAWSGDLEPVNLDDYSLSDGKELKEKFVFIKDDEAREWPYEVTPVVKKYKKGSEVNVIYSVKNKHGNVWYELTDGSFVWSGDLKPAEETLLPDTHLPSSDRVAGDVTADGKTDIMDVIRLLKYVSGWSVKVNQVACDVTGDGLVNIMDVIRLLKYVSGWNVTIY